MVRSDPSYVFYFRKIAHSLCPMGSWALDLTTITLVFELLCDLRCRMMGFGPSQKLATSPGVPGTCPDVANVVLGT